MEEQELLAKIRSLVDRPASSDLIVGNGDDGAVFSSGSANVVVATDIAVEGVHFRLDWSTPYQVGRKISAANLADICAMGGWPRFLLVSAVIPKALLAKVEDLSRGIADEADLVGAQVIGGDISSGDSLIINITAIGYCEKVITRSGARSGDFVVISHLPGWSKAGLELLRSGAKPKDQYEKQAIAHHLTPTVPYQRYKDSFGALHCATDISDGLLIDVGHIALASEVNIDIETDLIRKELAKSGLSELQLSNHDLFNVVLTSGEEHVLIGTVADPALVPGFNVIGRVNDGAGVTIDGKPAPESDLGFQHRWV